MGGMRVLVAVLRRRMGHVGLSDGFCFVLSDV